MGNQKVKKFLEFVTNREFRKWLYNVGIAVLALFILYGVLTAEEADGIQKVLEAVIGLGIAAVARKNLNPPTE